MRKKMRTRRDKAVFENTARRTKVANIPGHKVPRGGIHL